MMKGLDKKEAFFSYIYGYLNSLCVYRLRMPENMPWKEFKIKEVSAYLGLSQRGTNLLFKFCHCFGFLEIVFSYIIVTFHFIYCSILKLFLISKPIDAEIITIGEGYSYSRQVGLINKTAININEIITITIPFVGKRASHNERHVNVLTKLSYYDVCIALIWSIQLMTYMNKKYGRRDFLLRYYSSFEFLLAFIFSRKVDVDHTFLFFSTYSRWAYLNGGLCNKKIFVQHGFLSGRWKLVKKIGTVDHAYYINEEQRKICERMLFENTPSFNYEKGLEFTLFPATEKTCVLIIGNYDKNDVEQEVIARLHNNQSLLLFVKPHPNMKNITFYHRMQSEFGVALLEKNDFPKVDYVISYNSTLATQYEDAGVTVYRYADADFEEELHRLEKG